jgi:hypothetical protein
MFCQDAYSGTLTDTSSRTCRKQKEKLLTSPAWDCKMGKKKVYPRFEQGLPEDFEDESKSGVITTT